MRRDSDNAIRASDSLLTASCSLPPSSLLSTSSAPSEQVWPTHNATHEMKFKPFHHFKFKRSKLASEEAPLLAHPNKLDYDHPKQSHGRKFAALSGLVLASVVLMFVVRHAVGFRVEERFRSLPNDPHKAAKVILAAAPVIVSCLV